MTESKILYISCQDSAIEIQGGFLIQTFSVHTAAGLFWDSCADGFVLVHSPCKIQADPFPCCCCLFAGCRNNGGCRHFGREAGQRR